jgi:uncharacterized membrane protein YeaQ/YmgE (transglycosylase-associated protein family)
MGIIVWIVFGLLVGIVAKVLTPGRDPGGSIGRTAGWYGEGDPVGFLMAVVGSIVLLVLYRLVIRGPRGV